MSKEEDEGGQQSLLPNVENVFHSSYGTFRTKQQVTSNDSRESFWREMEHSDYPFQTVCFFFLEVIQ
jgi:hypothetical protein